MTDDQNAFTRLDTVLGEGGPAAVLDQLIDSLESQDKHHELFEALKMKLRHGLGLPLRYNDSGDELDEATRQGLEEGLKVHSVGPRREAHAELVLERLGGVHARHALHLGKQR